LKEQPITNPIQIGVCGWGDHDLYPAGTPSREKLAVYAGHFPVVEVDSSYHAIQPPERMARWSDETPDDFRFVIKAYREMTGHGRKPGAPERTAKQIFRDFSASVRPVVEAGKLAMVLFQFPPWYDCKKEHVHYIRRCREAFRDWTVAVEFRHQSWFQPAYREQTLRFLEKEKLVHVVCDEPQAGEGSVPIVPVVTHPDHVLVRFHGRNRSGWTASGRSNEEWRKVRYAYRYSREELAEWVPRIETMKQQTRQVTLLFNNNSEGDAVDSARMMMDLLGVVMKGLGPRQLGIF
jgi:uncharacterized protein YecE (DUF72 family)